MLIINLSQDIEEIHGSYDTIESCWEQATKIARSPEVFSVRCTFVEEK